MLSEFNGRLAKEKRLKGPHSKSRSSGTGFSASYSSSDGWSSSAAFTSPWLFHVPVPSMSFINASARRAAEEKLTVASRIVGWRWMKSYTSGT